jgi:DNA polymerase III subunit gamma/tau
VTSRDAMSQKSSDVQPPSNIGDDAAEAIAAAVETAESTVVGNAAESTEPVSMPNAVETAEPNSMPKATQAIEPATVPQVAETAEPAAIAIIAAVDVVEEDDALATRAPEATALPDADDDWHAIAAGEEPPAPAQARLQTPPATSPDSDRPPQRSAAAQSQADAASRRAGGASAALDVLRNAGMKLSGDRSRASAAAAPLPKAAQETRPKAAAPRVAVPTPNRERRAQQQPDAAPARTAGARQSGNASVPPWEEIPPDAPGALDDYIPASADDAFFAPPDDGYLPVFDNGPDDVRVAPAALAATAIPPLDTRPLPPAIALDSLGFEGDWPALAAGLSLKGIAHQLAFNSELMALDGATLKLNVPVPQYADAAQVAKLKTALAERLGKPVEVVVEVGPARRTAAAFDAAERAQRQQEAEREIGADPFVQSLIREFGASIVPGSIRPLAVSAQGSAGGANATH